MLFRFGPVLILILLLSDPLPISADQTEISIDYSHRQVPEGWDPDHGVIEGSIIATFTANNPIELVIADPTFVRINEYEFQRHFLWDESDTLRVDFIDDDDQIIHVAAFPAPVYPSDPANHSVPMIRINTDPPNLWDPEIGIYVWGNHVNFDQHGIDWEREAWFEYWDADDNLIFSRGIGLRINGGYSRCYLQKSFRLYFDHTEGEPNGVEYDLFGSPPYISYRLLLRNGRGPRNLINDIWATSIYADLGHLSSRSSYAAVFLNNEYWGAYCLRERLDDEWVEKTLGHDDEVYVLIKDGESLHGDPSDWWDLLDFASAPGDYTSHPFFQTIDDQLDLTSYVDWLIINIFCGASDNGFQTNLAILRLEGEKWQYVMWDEDDIFKPDNLEADFFSFFASSNETEYEERRPPVYSEAPWWMTRPWFLLFSHLMENAQFRYLFAERLEVLTRGHLSINSMHERFDHLAAVHDPELEWHAERVGWWSFWTYYSYLGDIKDWTAARLPIVLAQGTAFLHSHRTDVELIAFAASRGDTANMLTWQTAAENGNYGFLVYRAEDREGPFSQIASYLNHKELEGAAASSEVREYTFLDTDPLPEMSNYYRLSHVGRDHLEVIHQWVEEAVSIEPTPTLFINELLAKNDTDIVDEAGEHEDWVELYNPGEDPISLAGMYLTDDPADSLKWIFPEVSIPGEGFLLVWCDNDPGDGPLHANFKLSAEGEFVGLYGGSGFGHVCIDSVTFSEQVEDVSLGRYQDGGAPWVNFVVTTPGESNTGGVATGVTELQAPTLQLGANYPNPFNPSTVIEFTLPRTGLVNLILYDTAGREVRSLISHPLPAGTHRSQWEGRNTAGHPASSGVYLVRLLWEGEQRTRKILMVR